MYGEMELVEGVVLSEPGDKYDNSSQPTRQFQTNRSYGSEKYEF